MVLSKQTDLNKRQIEVWFRNRKKIDSHTTLPKFCDSGLHFLFYLVSFTYGISILYNKPWFSKTIECWERWLLQVTWTSPYEYICGWDVSEYSFNCEIVEFC